MLRRIVSGVMLKALLFSALTFGVIVCIEAQVTDMRVINPDTDSGNFVFSSENATVGRRFNATVWLFDVGDLFAYQVRLDVDDGLLNITDAWLPYWNSDWVFNGRTTVPVDPTLYDFDGDNSSETVKIGSTILVGDTFYGSGLLCIVEFEIIYVPAMGNASCNLDIDNVDTYLMNFDLNEIPTTKTNGYYEIFTSQSEEWVPYVPHTTQVELDYRRENGTSYMNILIEFPSTGFNVSDWGTPIIIGRDISVNAEIWRWTGIVFPVVTPVSYTYVLGTLTPGEYVFTFNVWGFPVQNITFSIFIIVPDDYSTIQKAINNANAGDMVFVRSGTYYEHVVINKTLSLIGENRETTIIDANMTSGLTHAVLLITESDARVSGFTISNCSNGDGITIQYGRNIVISENVITSNEGRGVHVDHTSEGNITITDNIIFHNFPTDNFGAVTLLSNNNMVHRNFIVNNSIGILLHESYTNNTVTENTISNNSYGIYRYKGNTHGNTIFHNNLINNTNQLDYELNSNNTWDNGCEGNYWSDYSGVDTSIPPDGIGDTELPWKNVDYYPLMNPYWNPTDINHDLKVDIKDIGTATVAYGSKPEDSNWNPHADITGPEHLIPDDKVDIRDIALIAINYGETWKP